MNQSEKHPSPPLTETLKSISDAIGIRLNEHRRKNTRASNKITDLVN